MSVRGEDGEAVACGGWEGGGPWGFKMVVNKVISGAVRSPARPVRRGGGGQAGQPRPRPGAGDAPRGFFFVSLLVWGRAGARGRGGGRCRRRPGGERDGGTAGAPGVPA